MLPAHQQHQSAASRRAAARRAARHLPNPQTHLLSSQSSCLFLALDAKGVMCPRAVSPRQDRPHLWATPPSSRHWGNHYTATCRLPALLHLPSSHRSFQQVLSDPRRENAPRGQISSAAQRVWSEQLARLATASLSPPPAPYPTPLPPAAIPCEDCRAQNTPRKLTELF